MPVKPASAWATAWTGAAGKANTNWQAGVNGTTADWAGLTVAAQSRMQIAWDQAVASGRWANGVNARGTQGWKTATVAKEARYANGYTTGADAYGRAAAKLQPAIQALVNALPPRGDINANLDRVRFIALGLAQQRGNFSGK